MAGHSKFSNIKHRKGAQDAKRAKIFTKLVREIIVAAKTGMPDPSANSRLRGAIAAARAKNLPKDRIESAIKKGSSPAEGEDYQEMRYEGYAPGGIAIIVDALTDNRNRTAAEVRNAFTKYGGSLGESGSVNYMFDRIGLIEYPASVCDAEKMLEAAIEAGAEDCESGEELHIITFAPESLNEVRDFLSKEFGDAESARLSWRPQNTIEITSQEQAEKLIKFIDVLEDNDDVQYVSGNFDIDEEILQQSLKAL